MDCLTPLTGAQATTLAGIMLVAHTFPLELQVTYKAGLKRRYVFLWRVLGAFLFGYCVHFICSTFHLFQNKAHVIFTPTHTDLTIWDWAITQGQTLLKIAAVIFILMVMMKVFRILKITEALEKILRPLLGKIGISNSVIPLTIIGLVLGLVDHLCSQIYFQKN